MIAALFDSVNVLPKADSMNQPASRLRRNDGALGALTSFTGSDKPLESRQTVNVPGLARHGPVHVDDPGSNAIAQA